MENKICNEIYFLTSIFPYDSIKKFKIIEINRINEKDRKIISEFSKYCKDKGIKRFSNKKYVWYIIEQYQLIINSYK